MDRPGLMDHESTIDALEDELTRTVALSQRTPAELEIPTCPGWSAAALWRHLGKVHRWATEIVASRATEPTSSRTVAMDLPEDDRWAPWLAEGADRLVAALRDTAAMEPLWVWGTDPHARWWARRQLHEAVVHDADAALALGEEFTVSPLVAADGICELLDNAPARLSWPDATPPIRSVSVHLHATDLGNDSDTGTDADDGTPSDAGEWMISTGDGTVTYTHDHGKGDVALRGAASALMLVVNRRRALADAPVEVFGDSDALEVLLTAATH